MLYDLINSFSHIDGVNSFVYYFTKQYLQTHYSLKAAEYFCGIVETYLNQNRYIDYDKVDEVINTILDLSKV